MTAPFLRIPTLLLTPLCRDCGIAITLVRIEPASPGHDLRTFECAGCGYSKNIDFEIRQNYAQRQQMRLPSIADRTALDIESARQKIEYVELI